MVLFFFVCAIVLFFALVIGISFIAALFDCGGSNKARCEVCRFGYRKRDGESIRCRLGGLFEGGACEDFAERADAE